MVGKPFSLEFTRKTAPLNLKLGRVNTTKSFDDEGEIDEADKHHVEFFESRENRRNPFRRRNSRSISLRRLYIARSYSHALTRLLLGGTTGMKFRSSASCRVSSP